MPILVVLEQAINFQQDYLENDKLNFVVVKINHSVNHHAKMGSCHKSDDLRIILPKLEGV